MKTPPRHVPQRRLVCPKGDATRGQNTTMTTLLGYAKTFCLCVKSSFQDDYQSSCGLTWGDIIADSAVLCARFRRLTPAVSLGIPAAK